MMGANTFAADSVSLEGNRALNNFLKAAKNVKHYLFLSVALIAALSTNAQSVKMGINPTSINSNSALEIEATNKGLLIPRLALVAITNPAPLTASLPDGMMVYNNGTAVRQGLYYWSASRWNLVTDSARVASVVSGIGSGANYFGLGGGNGVYMNTTGANNSAAGTYAFTAGQGNAATGSNGMAMGINNSATGNYSTSIGQGNVSTGVNSTTVGLNNTANGFVSLAQGQGNLIAAAATNGTAIGLTNTVNGIYGTAVGQSNTINATVSNGMAIGLSNTVSKDYATAIGHSNTASGKDALATGNATVSGPGDATFTANQGTKATANYSAAFNNVTEANGVSSAAFGNNTKANGTTSFVTGNGSTTGVNATSAVAMGESAQSNGLSSVALGKLANAGGESAMAVGFTTTASGQYSAAVGDRAAATGTSATALGFSATASGLYSVAIGHSSVASGTDAIAIGNGANTNNQSGSLAISDASGGVSNTSGNQFVSKFANGYIMYTNNTSNGLALTASAHYPLTDGQMELGTSSNRFNHIYAQNGLLQTSDVRFKKNIAEMNYGLATIMKLRPVTYNWKTGDQERKIGFIAQELKEVVPEVVHTGNDKDQTLGVNYAELTSVLVKAMQEQQQEIVQLKEEVKALKAATAKN